MWLVVGLGNPGPEYAETRHNVGFMILDQLAFNWQLGFEKKKFTSVYAFSPEKEVYLVKPLTFMNRSGVAVKKWVKDLALPLSNLLVVVDDLDLSLGEVRLRMRGGDAGHHGLGSIIRELQTSDFPRLRIGIGRPKKRGSEAEYVLSPFKKSEKRYLSEAFEIGLNLIENLIKSEDLKI